MGISGVGDGLYVVNTNTGERSRVKQPDELPEDKRTPYTDTLVLEDAGTMDDKFLQSLRDALDQMKAMKGRLLDGAVPDEEFALEKQGVKWSSQTVWDSNGERFSVYKWYDPATGDTFDGDYFNVLENIARGEKEEDHLTNYAYMDNLAYDILKFFSTAATVVSDKAYIKERLNAVIEEIRQNIAAGKADPTENLQTKFTLKGADWTLSELLGAANALEKASSASWQGEYNTINSTLWMDYKHYAYLGMAQGYVSQYAKENLNKEQAASINSIMQSMVDNAIGRNNRYMEENQEKTDAEWQKILASPDYPQYKSGWDERRKYYSYGAHSGVATNKQIINSIMELFASVAAGKPFSGALNEYYGLMKPVYNSLNHDPQLCFNSESKDFLTFFNSLYGR